MSNKTNEAESKPTNPNDDLFATPVRVTMPESPPQIVAEAEGLYVHPHECCLWPQNPRHPGRLNEENTLELRESLIANGQAMAAIVRYNATGAPKYEIIAGSRRWWCVQWLRENGYPDTQLKIEVRDLDDEAAFRLTSLENNDRTGVSAYETGLSLREPLRNYYGGRQVAMAKALGRTEAWVSRHLTLAEIPSEVADAYVDWSGIRMKHGAQLVKRHNDDPKGLLDAAAKLIEIQSQRAAKGKLPVSPQESFNFLLQDPRLEAKKLTVKLPSLGPKYQPHVSVVKLSTKKMLIEVNLASGVKPEQVGSFVQKHFEKLRNKTPGSPRKTPRPIKR